MHEQLDASTVPRPGSLGLEAAASGPLVRDVARAILTPLWLRLRRGEGLLLLVAVALAVAGGAAAADVIAQALLLALLLAALYAWNDLADCEHDLRDPGKDHGFARFLAGRRGLLSGWLAALAAALVAASGLLLGPAAATSAAAVLALNAAYSLLCKGVPGLDVLCVAAWGGCYAAVPGVAGVPLLALIASMTGICHVFQTRRDAATDAANGVRTVVVHSPRLAAAALLALCLAIGVLLAVLHAAPLWVTAAAPALLWWSRLRNDCAWFLARSWFGVVLLVLLLVP